MAGTGLVGTLRPGAWLLVRKGSWFFLRGVLFDCFWSFLVVACVVHEINNLGLKFATYENEAKQKAEG